MAYRHPLLKPFYGGLRGRFPGFAPISSHSPHKSSNIRAIYHLPRKLLRDKPAWCPVCYVEWREAARPAYEPLLWECHPVTVCLKHHRKLESHCPYCQKQQPVIRFQTPLDQCARCNAWLGSEAKAGPEPEGIEWQRWVIQVLEELHVATASSGIPSWEQFFTNLSASCEARGEQSRFAELAGLARGQLATWLRRSHTPTLGSILELCYACNVTPLQILLGDLAPLKQVIAEGKPRRPPRARRPIRSLDRKYCLERIQAILDGKEKSLGYVQLAHQLGYGGNILRYHFPRNVYYYRRKLRNIGDSNQNSDMKPCEKRSAKPCWPFMHKGPIRRIAKSLNESLTQP